MTASTSLSTKTLVIVILDESGSMSEGNKTNETMVGFNSIIENQKDLPEDTARFYLIKFNSVVSVVHSGISLASVPVLTSDN